MPPVNPYLYESDEAGSMHRFELLKLKDHTLFTREAEICRKTLKKLKNPGAKVPPQYCSV